MPRHLTLALSLLLLATISHAQSDLTSRIDSDYGYLDQLYKHLHRNPELSFQEVNTAKRIGDELVQLGFNVTRDFGGHGVVGVMENGEGPTVMIRTDLDALPITEATGLPYASSVTSPDRDGNEVGVMHACGHDIHMSVFVGTARRLADTKDQWQGTLIMIGQPAEERSGGAKAMLADGLFERFPRPDYNLALHVASDMPAGTVGAVSGYFMANVDSVDIEVFGAGGHGAYPHRTKDPITLAAQLILALQTIVSREISPLEPAVVTVGSVHGGSQHNIISDQVKLQLTLRSYTEEVRNQTIDAIRRISSNLALAAGVPEDRLPVVTVLDEHTPASYNNPTLTERILEVFERQLGSEQILPLSPEMVGEDFGRYGAVEPKIPSLMFRLGTVSAQAYQQYQDQGAALPSLHSAKYAPDPEPSIKTGILAMTSAALELLQK